MRPALSAPLQIDERPLMAVAESLDKSVCLRALSRAASDAIGVDSPQHGNPPCSQTLKKKCACARSLGFGKSSFLFFRSIDSQHM